MIYYEKDIYTIFIDCLVWGMGERYRTKYGAFSCFSAGGSSDSGSEQVDWYD